MTPQDAMALVGILKAAFPHVEFPKDSVKLYAGCIQDLRFDAARAGVLHLIAEPHRRFMPTIGEIRAAAFQALSGLPTAEEAWGEVIQQIHAVGVYGPPQFSHPLIEKAVRAVDWRTICLSETPGVERAHFLRVYDSFRDRHEQQMLRLPASRQAEQLFDVRRERDGLPW